MWNSLSNINFYENLLDRKSTGNNKVSENDVNITQLCRTCLREAPDTDNLLKEFEIGAMNINLDGKLLRMIDMLAESTGLQVHDSDTLPHQICNNCIQNVSGAYFFRMQSHKAEKTLLKLITALSEESVDECYENVQHLEETSREEKQETINGSIDDETCELMEIEFDTTQYQIQTDCESSEVTDSIAANDVIEEHVFEDDVEGVQVEFFDKADVDDDDDADNDDDNEDVKMLGELIVEVDKELPVKKSRKESLKCSECEVTFELKKDFYEHNQTIHPSQKFFECSTCNAKFGKMQTLKRHLKIHQADQKNKLCTFCGKTFTRADDLKRHVRTHTNERPYACKLCPKSYKQTSELKEHMVTHSRDKIYTCEICGKSLLTRNGHYVHMKVHAGVKNHTCNYCGKQYVTSGELHSHIRHIHDKKKPFACTFENCERKFATKLSLDIHQRAHTGERPYGCPICGKKLATSSSLSDHIKIHTGEKRFFCKTCKKTFNSASALKKHLPRHDSSKSETDSIQDVSYCSECGLNFLNLNELTVHLKSHNLEGGNQICNSRLEVIDDINHTGSTDFNIKVKQITKEQSTTDLKHLSKEEFPYLVEYSDTEIVHDSTKEPNGLADFLDS